MNNKKKRIGIITYHRAINYGAVLQAFSLRFILGYRFDAQIIDYRNCFIEKSYYIRQQGLYMMFKYLVKCLLRPKSTLPDLKRRVLFMLFRKKYLFLSKKYTKENIDESNLYYDLFIVGSDQVWTTKWSECDLNYFLSFADDCKKYSYAASVSYEINDDERDIIRKNLNLFRSLIVREPQSVESLYDIGVYKKIRSACDPVFFLDRNQWERIFHLKKNKKKYILLYLIEPSIHSLDCARMIAKRDKSDIYCLNISGISGLPHDIIDIRGAGPIDFLNLIMNANLVITTSFHGLAFSIIMHTPFLYELSSNQINGNQRILNLEDRFDIKHRRIIDNNYIFDPVKWGFIDKVKELYKNESIKLLYSSILSSDEG